jgi:hypothetical protein
MMNTRKIKRPVRFGYHERRAIVPEKSAFSDKKVGIIMTYAKANPFAARAVNTTRSIQDTCAFVGAMIVGMVHVNAEHPCDITKNVPIIQAAFGLAKKIGS